VRCAIISLRFGRVRLRSCGVRAHLIYASRVICWVPCGPNLDEWLLIKKSSPRCWTHHYWHLFKCIGGSEFSLSSLCDGTSSRITCGCKLLPTSLRNYNSLRGFAFASALEVWFLSHWSPLCYLLAGSRLLNCQAGTCPLFYRIEFAHRNTYLLCTPSQSPALPFKPFLSLLWISFVLVPSHFHNGSTFLFAAEFLVKWIFWSLVLCWAVSFSRTLSTLMLKCHLELSRHILHSDSTHRRCDINVFCPK